VNRSAGSVSAAGRIACRSVTPTKTPTPSAQPSATRTPVPAQTATLTATASRTTDAAGGVPYPNPARDAVRFAWPGAPVDKARIEIYNLSGERIASVVTEHPANNVATWAVGRVPPGIYLCQIFLTRDGREQGLGIKKVAVTK